MPHILHGRKQQERVSSKAGPEDQGASRKSYLTRKILVSETRRPPPYLQSVTVVTVYTVLRHRVSGLRPFFLLGL